MFLKRKRALWGCRDRGDCVDVEAGEAVGSEGGGEWLCRECSLCDNFMVHLHCFYACYGNVSESLSLFTGLVSVDVEYCTCTVLYIAISYSYSFRYMYRC